MALRRSDSGKRKPMATSLYDLSVPTFLQTVRAVGGFLDRAAKHCAETGADPDDFVEARLFADMAPFHFQIEAACAPCRVGGGGREDRRVRPAGPGRAGPLRRAAGDDRRGGSGAGGVHPRRGRRLGGQGAGPSDRPAAGSPSRRRPSSSRSRCPTSISTPSPPTTSCARAACRSASATTRDGCVPSRPSR